MPAKSGERPRIAITWARPETRWAARPGRRASDSAMLTSGSLPISSAVTTSTIESELRLAATEDSMLERMPVTTSLSTASALSAFAFAFAFASACAFESAPCSAFEPASAGGCWA